MVIVADIIACVFLIIIGYIAIYCYNHDVKITKLDKGILGLSTNRVIYLSVAVVTSIILVTFFQLLYTISLLNQIKLIFLIYTIFPCAAVDYKTHKIPNLFLLCSLIIRICIFGIEFLISFPNAIEDVKNCVVGAAIIGGFFLVMFFLFKNSIGMGDIKLFAIIGLYQGLWGAINSVFFSLLVSFITSITLLISKKKKKKDVIAFAPCILLGTIIAICLAGM